jgi:hypothetical protein
MPNKKTTQLNCHIADIKWFSVNFDQNRNINNDF